MACTERFIEDGKVVERDCYDGQPSKSAEPIFDRKAGDDVGFLAKVRNFAAATVKHLAAGMPMASDAEVLRRHEICQGCEFFRNNACSKCGCPIVRTKKYVSKLSWADQECPVGKWGKEERAVDKS